MKLKVVVLDFEISTKAKQWALRLGIPLAISVVAGVALAAPTLTVWKKNDSLTADDLNSSFAAVTTPPGTILAYGGPIDSTHVPPSGWLLCDGTQLNALNPTYAALYAAIGVIYGGNSAAQVFNLPDLRGRTLVGAGEGLGLTDRVLGAKLGEEAHTLTLGEIPPHKHLVPNLTQLIAGRAGTVGGADKNDGPPNAEYTDVQGGGGPHNNMQPSMVINYLIKL